MNLQEIQENVILKNYFNTSKELLKISFPETSERELDEYLVKTINENFQEKKVYLLNNYTNKQYKTNLSELVNKLYQNKNTVISGYGVLYTNKEKNEKAKLLLDLIAERKTEKKLMFKAKESNDAVAVKFHDNNQKTKKEYTNSLYGIAGEAHAYIYNPYNANATTSSAFVVTTSAVVGFESLFGNFKLANNAKVLLFINRVINESFNIKNKKLLNKISDYLEKKYQTQEDYNKAIFERLSDISLDNSDNDIRDKIKEIIPTLNSNQKCLLMIKNNFSFFVFLPIIRKRFLNYFTSNDFIKIEPYIDNHINKENDEEEKTYQNRLEKSKILNNFYEVIKELVGHFYTYGNREKFVLTQKRRYILTIDTDSTFIFTGWFRDKMKKYFELEQSKENKISVSNIITFVCSRFIKDYLRVAINKMNLKEEDIKRIEMKNEFYIERIVLTKNKKQYISKILAQEGVIFKDKKTNEIKPFIEYKGLNLKKSTTPEKARKILENIIQSNILDAEEINIQKFLQDLMKIRQEVEKSVLEEGSTEFCPLTSYGNKYKFPERIQSVRGSRLWNALYPNEPVLVSAKCMLIPLKNLLTLEDWEREIKPRSEKMFNIVKEVFFDDKVFGKYETDVICVPWSKEELPKWLRPYVDIQDLTDKIFRLTTVIMKSLNMVVLKVRNEEYISNLVEF